jgi:hypothetical protein
VIVIVTESADIVVAAAAVAIVATVAVDVVAAVDHAARHNSELVASELLVGGAAAVLAALELH